MVSRVIQSALFWSLHPLASIFEKFSSFRLILTLGGHALLKTEQITFLKQSKFYVSERIMLAGVKGHLATKT